MKIILTLTITLVSFTIFGQNAGETKEQTMTLEKWNEESKTNIRLLPKYGHVRKNDAQRRSDEEFIKAALKQDSTKRKASDHLISLGFRYLRSDIKTALYRFNQAYLLDSTNADIYWGYGGVFLTLGDYIKAEQKIYFASYIELPVIRD